MGILDLGEWMLLKVAQIEEVLERVPDVFDQLFRYTICPCRAAILSRKSCPRMLSGCLTHVSHMPHGLVDLLT